MFSLTGGIIITLLGSVMARMFTLLFLVILLGGLAALLMVFVWAPEWTTYDRPDDKWRKNSEYPPTGSNKSVFEGFDKIRL